MGNQIEELKELYAKEKKYLIPKEPKKGQKQIEVAILPLGLDDIGSLDIKQDAPMSEIAKNVKTLFAKSLGIDEEEAGKLSFEYMQDLIDAIMEANGRKITNIADLLRTISEGRTVTLHVIGATDRNITYTPK